MRALAVPPAVRMAPAALQHGFVVRGSLVFMRVSTITQEGVVLSGGLSNLDRDLFQSLTGDNCRKVRKQRTAARGGWPDGRRASGSVSGAIIAALGGGEEMKVKAIRDEVERLLGGKVSRHSVTDYLLTRSEGPRPLFERTRHGHYRLLQ